MKNKTADSRTKGKFRQHLVMTVMIVVGLVLVNFAVFLSPDMSVKRLLKYAFHYCDYHLWPVWYATFLWIIAVGTVLYTAVQFPVVQKRLQSKAGQNELTKKTPRTKFHSSYVIVGTLTVLVIAAFFTWCPPRDLAKWLTKIFYYRLYLQFGYTPLIDLIEGGQVSWRLFVIPSVGIIFIGLLLAVRHRKKIRKGLSASMKVLIWLIVAYATCGGLILEAKGPKLVLVEKAEILQEDTVHQTAETESEKNKDGGYNANVNIVQCFAAMEYRYTGGRYVDEPIRFRLRSPKEMKKDKKYPLIIWLHGFGESNNDNKRQLAHVHYAIKSFAGKDQLDFFMLATQCPADNPSWENSISQEGQGDAPITIMNEILGHLVNEYPIDEDRIGVIGVCSGGDAAWRYVGSHPGRFSSFIPFSCSPSSEISPSAFEKTAVWAFNNKGDTVPFQPTVDMVQQINTLGGIARIKLREGGLHITWDRPLARQELIRWMIHQDRHGGGPFPWNAYYHRTPPQVVLMFGLPTAMIILSLVVLYFKKHYFSKKVEKCSEK